MSNGQLKGIFEVGDVLNNTYRIEEVLGRGGTSEVYRARSEISGRVMALKALRSEFSRNEDYLALMTREEDMREIRHDAIVRYYDNQRTDDGHIYLVMDYVDGPGLDKKLKQGGMTAADLLIVCERVTEGLVAAHEKNIVHRDLSPDNIILRNGNPADAVIIDFGIAKDTNPGAETIVGNEFAGKYAYAAPEQLSGKTDARADIYALGALLLATFRGKAPDIGNNPMEVVEKKGRPLETEGVPEPLRFLIDQMTHPDRDKRFQSAADVLSEVRGARPAAIQDTVDDERTVIAPMPKPAPSSPTAIRGDIKSVPTKVERKSGWLTPVLTIVVLLAVGTGVYFTGLADGLLGPRYPVADPYTLVANRAADGTAAAVGHVPSEEVLSAISKFMANQGGTGDLKLARGDIAPDWGAGIMQLLDTVSPLPEWQVQVTGNQVQISGLANDRTTHESISATLAADGMPAGLSGNVNIELGPRIVTADMLKPILEQYSDCGDLRLMNASPIGYPSGAVIEVSGRIAEVGTRVQLTDALRAAIGDRDLVLNAEVLNPTLCLIDSALPNAPSGGFSVEFGFGDRPDKNDTGRYFVGENPVIDVIIPSDVKTGYLFVSALDVSGNVFHLLPNLYQEENNIEVLRQGLFGPIDVRVAHKLADSTDGTKLAFVVDDTSLGKTKILVIRSDSQIFEGLRPTTESAGGYAEALRLRTGPVQSLDSRILTTTKKP